MRAKEALKLLLGIPDPWEIEDVSVSGSADRIDVHLRPGPADSWLDGNSSVPCPQCGAILAVGDEGETQAWRHVNIGTAETHLHVRMPGLSCESGCSITVPWHDPDSPFTDGMRNQFVNALRFCTDVPAACRLLDVTLDDINRDRHLNITGLRLDAAGSQPAPSVIAAAPWEDSPAAAPPHWDEPPVPATRHAQDNSSVPAVSHPNWQRLLDDALPIEVRALGLQMLLARVRMSLVEENTREPRLAKIGEVRDYCVKYQRFVQAELDQLFA